MRNTDKLLIHSDNEKKSLLYEKILNSISEGVFITDSIFTEQKSVTILYVNKAFEKHTGFSKNDLIGESLNILQFCNDQPEEISLHESLKKGLSYSTINQCKNKNGDIIFIDLTIIPVKENHIVTNFIGLLSDVTESNRSVEEKKQLMVDLLQINNDLKQFSYITSHNIRSPLTNIMAIVQLIEENNKDENITRLLKLLRLSTDQLNTTIQDLINVLILKEGGIKEKTLVNIAEIWQRIKLENKLKIDEANVKFKERFTESWIRCNKVYLKYILEELLVNAIKFRLPDRLPEIKISTDCEKGDVVLRFVDNGSGVSEKLTTERLCGLYQRFHSKVDGKGLGLFMVQYQLQSMNASINITSSKNHGFWVSINFPGKD